MQRAAARRCGLVLLVGFAQFACKPALGREGRYTAGDSMLPSIPVGETIAVHAIEGEPTRGLVIVFRAPEKPESQYVKRIVGLPGDTLATRGTELVINGTPVPRCRVGVWGYDEEDGTARRGDLWLEALEGRRWLVFHDTAASAVVVAAGPWTVAPGEVFLLGDNREHSHDSRVWRDGKGGGLPLRFIVGSAEPVATPTLPKGAETLAPALDGCMVTLSR